MRFGIRQEVDLNDFRKYLDGLQGIPIELALPHDMDSYLKTHQFLPELESYIGTNGLICQSTHAPQGAISSPSFMSWSVEVVRFAEAINSTVVVFHPEQRKTKIRLECQRVAVNKIQELQKVADAIVGIETFGGERRILKPSEMVEFGLRMVLDVSHVSEEESRQLIKTNFKNIVGIHLSAIGTDPKTGEAAHHLPINDFCFEILDSLHEVGWNGLVTLEYLPWYHDRLIEDREKLEDKYS